MVMEACLLHLALLLSSVLLVPVLKLRSPRRGSLAPLVITKIKEKKDV